jgi:hypothetical protein
MKAPVGSGHWRTEFEHNEETINYELKTNRSEVELETYTVGGELRLERGLGGAGKIFAEKENKFLDFQSPATELAVHTRRDSTQHTFFEPLYEWGHTVYHFSFGLDLGKTGLILNIKDVKIPDPDPRDTTKTAIIFFKGMKEFGNDFKVGVQDDMKRLRYPIRDIDQHPAQLQVAPGTVLPGPLMSLFVQEIDLGAPTDQLEMSAGMFRALAVIIQLNYAALAASPSCIIIDDIGEGLDFERSCWLIELIREKASAAKVQLVMSTNDRFVMNTVPLDDWSVLRRTGGLVQVYNRDTATSAFERFELTGLNNFDFFAMDFTRPAASERLAEGEDELDA